MNEVVAVELHEASDGQWVLGTEHGVVHAASLSSATFVDVRLELGHASLEVPICAE